LGATVFEKHFTLDRDLPGPDHWFSESPEDAGEWIESVRQAHRMRGTGLVQPTDEERKMRVLARRSVTALRDIGAGESLTAANIGLRRPGDGLPPSTLPAFMGRKAARAIAKGQQLQYADLS